MKGLHYYFAFILTLLYITNISIVIGDQSGLHITFWPIIAIDVMFMPLLAITWYQSVYNINEDKPYYYENN